MPVLDTDYKAYVVIFQEEIVSRNNYSKEIACLYLMTVTGYVL